MNLTGEYCNLSVPRNTVFLFYSVIFCINTYENVALYVHVVTAVLNTTLLHFTLRWLTQSFIPMPTLKYSATLH